MKSQLHFDAEGVPLQGVLLNRDAKRAARLAYRLRRKKSQDKFIQLSEPRDYRSRSVGSHMTALAMSTAKTLGHFHLSRPRLKWQAPEKKPVDRRIEQRRGTATPFEAFCVILDLIISGKNLDRRVFADRRISRSVVARPRPDRVGRRADRQPGGLTYGAVDRGPLTTNSDTSPKPKGK
jgi:hypothetical protein